MFVRARRLSPPKIAYVNIPAPTGASRPTIQAQQIGVPDIGRAASPPPLNVTNHWGRIGLPGTRGHSGR